jgi:hypothetical protein
MTFLFNISGQSVVIAILVHAMFNTAARWLTALLDNGPLRGKLNPELVIGLCGIIIASILIAATRGRLAESETQE